MPPLRAAQASNAEFSPAYVPVALFIGGTSGIGQAIAEKLAFYARGNVHIFIIGRNRAAGEKTISKFPKPSLPSIVHEFISCDATLIANVNAVTKNILARFNKINFLVMSSGSFPTTTRRDETAEGIDRPLALHYYSRWKLITDCLPALTRAQEEGEMAKIFSVLGPGRGREIDLDDLGLKKRYSFLREAGQAFIYQDIMVEVRNLSCYLRFITNALKGLGCEISKPEYLPCSSRPCCDKPLQSLRCAMVVSRAGCDNVCRALPVLGVSQQLGRIPIIWYAEQR